MKTSNQRRSSGRIGVGRVLLVLAAVVLLGRVGAWQPVVDKPYRELRSNRVGFAGTQPIEGWAQVPFVRVHTLQRYSTTQVLAVADAPNGTTGVYVVTLGTTANDVSAQRLPWDVDPRAHVLPAAHEPDAFTIIRDNFIARVSCSATACEEQFSLPIPTLLVTTVKMLDSGAAALIGTDIGLWHLSSNATDLTLLRLTEDLVLSTTACGEHYFVGTETKVLQINQTGHVLDWEWVTLLDAGAGGAYGGPARDMTCDQAGTLFTTNQVSLNTRAPNGGIGRLDYQQGMPMNNASQVVMEPGTEAMWIGTPRALLRYSRGQDDPDWRFFHGDRFLPHSSNVTHVVALDADRVVVATTGGFALLTWENWTLRQKADWYRKTLLARHNRHGLVAECDMDAYGQLSSCTGGPNDNSGLWTSLLVSAYAHALTVEPSDEHAQAFDIFQRGLELLVNVTNVRGLMARTCVAPNMSFPATDNDWHNSSAPGLQGWHFKGDASSDEVVGHMFGHATAAALLPDSPRRNISRQYLLDIMNYIVDNDFYLIDVTGKHTRWGVWNPAEIDDSILWTNEHGVNSLQILAYLSAAAGLARSEQEHVKFVKAIKTLTTEANRFDKNMLNLKIEAPASDNYSDDELTFLPYMVMALGLNMTAQPQLAAALGPSLTRTWQFVRAYRSAPWNAIYTAVDGNLTTQADIDSIVWNLRTWPLELIDFPVNNTMRRDIYIDPEAERNGQVGDDDERRILPAYERPQLRWNGNPHDLDGGSGLSEGDPGAWLMPYWMARHYGLIVN